MSLNINGTDGISLAGQFNSASTFGHRNRIINGAMIVNQRGSSSSDVGAFAWGVDRFGAYENTSATSVTATQSSTAPTGFINSLLYTVGTGGTATASQVAYIRTKIEGLNVADLGWGAAGASTVTLSFWVRSSLTGTYCVNFRNSAQDRSYVSTYTISSANTWEQKTITVAGDTSGTWLKDNGIGIELGFDLGGGSNYNTTANAWAAGAYTNTSAQANLIGTTGATFYITGVQLENGSTATSFDYRPYGTELSLCQRYYFKNTSSAGGPFGTGVNTSTTASSGLCIFPVPMRTAPTALEQSGTASNYRVIGPSAVTCSSVPAIDDTSAFSSRVVFTVASGLTSGQGALIASASGVTAYLAWSAEL